jgi:uncharacterized protein (DUF58 family)
MINLQEVIKSYSFGQLELLSTQVVEGFITGLHRSPYHGFSVEFVEHRMYNAGESKRLIDWKLYAKTDKLFVKKFEDETNLRCQLVLDQSSSMYFPEKGFSKLQFGVFAAGALMQLLKRQRDAVGLSVFSAQIDSHTQSKLNTRHLKNIFLQLEQILEKGSSRNVESPSTADILHDLAERIHQRSLVVLLSDMFTSQADESVFEALQHLKFRKHELIIFHITDPSTERILDFPNRPHQFIDIETGQTIKLNPAHFREVYQEQMGNWYNQFKLRCSQLHIDLVEVDIRQPFEELMAAFLIKRQRLY